jgi:hypothetical protein
VKLRGSAALTVTVLASLVLLSALALPELALAHGLVGRADLPIPEWLFAWAAAVVLIVSFAALSVLWREPKLEGRDGFRRLGDAISYTLVNPVTEFAAGLIGVGLLVLVVVAGLFGEQTALSNFAPTFIYVIFWVGLVPASILLGDIFRPFNPWRAIGRATGFVTSRVAGPLPKPFAYPERLGRWPAAATILGFAWMELAYINSDRPSSLATATLVYTGITLLAMAVYGVEEWISKGEGFSVFYNLFSRISVVAVKEGRLGIRNPLSGLPQLVVLPGTVALLIVMLGTVTFDGASEGPLWADAGPWIQDRFTDLGFSPATGLELSYTVGIVLGLAVIAAIYLIGIAGARTVGHEGEIELARRFVHTLVPIAAVYMIAHYFSFLVYNGQAIGYLASDPFGEGWDLFGTAGGGINYGVIGATGIWYVQVGALVLGHVSGLVLAHDRALATYARLRDAVRSQYWMLGIMIAYTCFGLWLLAQANQ